MLLVGLLRTRAYTRNRPPERFFLVELHPMKVGGTMMNSFLVNVSLILCCSFPVVQFSAQAFSNYCSLTDVELLFDQQIRYLEFFKYFFANNVFIFVLLGISLVTMIFLYIKPASSSSPGNAASLSKFKEAAGKLAEKEKKEQAKEKRKAAAAVEMTPTRQQQQLALQ